MEQKEPNVDLSKVPWKYRRLCRSCKDYAWENIGAGFFCSVPFSLLIWWASSVSFGQLNIFLQSGFMLLIGFVGLLSLGAVVCLSAGLLIIIWKRIPDWDFPNVPPVCECGQTTLNALSEAKHREMARREQKPRIAACRLCLDEMILAEVMGICMLVLASIIPTRCTQELVSVTLFCLQPFFSALYIAHTRKNCADCNPKTRETPRIETTPEACENAVRERLNDRDVTYDLLMNGVCASDISRATGYPYSMVRSALKKIGREMYVKLLNQSLIVRDLNV